MAINAVAALGIERMSSEGKKVRKQARVVGAWIRLQPRRVQAAIALAAVVFTIMFLWVSVKDHQNIFVASEVVHFVGLCVLICKLSKERTCTGISSKSQELTAIFLSVRLYCSYYMEKDIHTILDLATVVTTFWVIYMIPYELKSTYMEDKDNFKKYIVILPCVFLAVILYPLGFQSHFSIFDRKLWAFVFTWSRSVHLLLMSKLFPYIHFMQIIDPFTAQYVFALGVARFLNCAHWILQFIDPPKFKPINLGFGLWPRAIIVAEIVQTFILADFCYFYVKRYVGPGGFDSLQLCVPQPMNEENTIEKL